MDASIWLSAIGLTLVLCLGFVAHRRLGRAAIPLTLLALMAATGSMFWVNDEIGPEVLVFIDLLRGRISPWPTPANHPVWLPWKRYAPGILAIVVNLWLILKIRRLPP